MLVGIVDRLRKSERARSSKLLRALWSRLGSVQDRYYRYRQIAACIAIENITECNRRCPYCPHFWSPRPRGTMSESLFQKIIDDLAGMAYAGHILFAPWSEPLLDHRLPSFVRHARDRLPKCNFKILTNGDLLTVELFHDLAEAGVSEFDVSDHFSIQGDHYVLDEPCEAIRTYLQLDETTRRMIHFHDLNYRRMRRLDRFHNRSGAVPLDDCVSVERQCGRCDFPEATLTIGCAGQVVLCARQWEDEPVFGNAGTEHLFDIWRKPEFIQARTDLRHGIFEYDVCARCGLGHILPPARVEESRATWPGPAR